MANVLDRDIVVSVFELQSRYYVIFQTNTLGNSMKPLIPLAMGWIIQLMFYKNGFGIKWSTKVNIFNKEIKTILG